MSTPPAYRVGRIDLSDCQRPLGDARDADPAEKGGGFPIAPAFGLQSLRTPNQITRRVNDWAPVATALRRETADDGDLEKVRAITYELQNESARLPRAAQLPAVSGLPPIDGVTVADVPIAGPKRITVEQVPIGRLSVPPVKQRGSELLRPARFLVAVVISAPLAGYFAIAGPYPIFGEAAVLELRPVQPPSTVQHFPQSPSASGLVNQDAVPDKPDGAPAPLAKLRTEDGETVGAGAGEKVPQPPPDREAGGNEVAAAINDRDAFVIADSDPLSLTRLELEKLSRFAWYRPTAWNVPPPLKQDEGAHAGSIDEVNAPAPDAASPPLPTGKDVRKDFILADSSRQFLMREELQGLSIDELVIARNEILARKGRHFREETLRDYFSQFSWYQPHTWDVALSTVEQVNVELIQSVEQSLAGKHATSLGRAR